MRDTAEDDATLDPKALRRVVSAVSVDASREGTRRRRKMVTQTPHRGSNPVFRDSAVGGAVSSHSVTCQHTSGRRVRRKEAF